ncbi:hypothetical protein CEV32_2640 [Brucella rhizosphaerae]|uniref:Uncharacterized protein n=1 Tax=Brucella rhizosphaerae TaxID=571254 RepID=A0A256F5X7_9HYPH|nr:hypothetical protein CEV32_2640 [Brucella rhizosphaerae]
MDAFFVDVFSDSAGKKCGITMNANESQIADLMRKRIITLGVCWPELFGLFCSQFEKIP